MGRILPLFPTSDPAATETLHADARALSGDGAATALPVPAEAPVATIRATNAAIAHALDRAADALSEREANEHRVSAYRRAADTVRLHETPLVEMLDAGGLAALEALPGVGERLAERIAAFVRTGSLTLPRDSGTRTVSAERLFQRLPGIGRVLARQIAEATGADSLEALEVAAYDGRLDALPAIGPRRIAALRATLDARLAGHTRRDARRARTSARRIEIEPSVADLLSIDAEYRDHARRGLLPTVAPRRFNPTGEAWLPVLETRRGPWRVTAFFSNTPRAHERGATRDWVQVYYETSDRRERTATVVTETRGDLRGRRVVRGREAECRAVYTDTLPLAA